MGYLSLDADHLGHLCVVCKRYHQWIIDQVQAAEIETMEFGQLTYQVGYMQGRLEAEMITEKDLEVLEEWEQELVN